VLHSDEDFETRYWRLRNARCEQWGRTTCFDLLLRGGALGVGGRKYAPQIAYLNGSTGPKSGFKKIWGLEITAENAEWGEALLWAWTEHWETSLIASASTGRASLIRAATSKMPCASGRSAAPISEADAS
jgi:hypothetical protein